MLNGPISERTHCKENLWCTEKYFQCFWRTKTFLNGQPFVFQLFTYVHFGEYSLDLSSRRWRSWAWTRARRCWTPPTPPSMSSCSPSSRATQGTTMNFKNTNMIQMWYRMQIKIYTSLYINNNIPKIDGFSRFRESSWIEQHKKTIHITKENHRSVQAYISGLENVSSQLLGENVLSLNELGLFESATISYENWNSLQKKTPNHIWGQISKASVIDASRSSKNSSNKVSRSIVHQTISSYIIPNMIEELHGYYFKEGL